MLLLQGCKFVYLMSNWQLKVKGGHFFEKPKFCALLANSHHRRDLFIIECTDKPHLVYLLGPRRKLTEFLSAGYHHHYFGASLAKPVQLASDQ